MEKAATLYIVLVRVESKNMNYNIGLAGEEMNIETAEEERCTAVHDQPQLVGNVRAYTMTSWRVSMV